MAVGFHKKTYKTAVQCAPVGTIRGNLRGCWMHAILAQMGLPLAPSGCTLSQPNTSCCCPASWSSTQPPLANGVLWARGRQRHCWPAHRHRCRAAGAHRRRTRWQQLERVSQCLCLCGLLVRVSLLHSFPPHTKPGAELFQSSLKSGTHSKIFWLRADSHSPCQDAERSTRLSKALSHACEILQCYHNARTHRVSAEGTATCAVSLWQITGLICNQDFISHTTLWQQSLQHHPLFPSWPIWSSFPGAHGRRWHKATPYAIVCGRLQFSAGELSCESWASVHWTNYCLCDPEDFLHNRAADPSPHCPFARPQKQAKSHPTLNVEQMETHNLDYRLRQKV